MTVSLASLLIQQTKDQIYSAALSIATAIGLPVTTWQPGDPTRSLYHVEAETLATLENVVVGYIQSGFLDFASGQWLAILADQVYGVTVPPATYATCDVVISNPGGGFYPGIDPGDLTFKNVVTGKTYHNTTGGTLASGPGTTLTVTVQADEAGSASSASAGAIAQLVTQLGSSTCSNALAAIAIDAQDDPTTRQQCRDSMGALSPNGPAQAYSYIARNPAFSLTNAVTRVRVYGNTTNGAVTVYLAGPSGPIAEADRALVQTAILKYATPLCISPTVLSATAVTIAITYSLGVYNSINRTSTQIQADVNAALNSMLAARPIGGDTNGTTSFGTIYTTLIESTIKAAVPQAFRVTVSVPATDTIVSQGQVAALGTVTPTIMFYTDP